MLPLQIANEENDDVTISREELEIVMKFAAIYTEQNALVLDAIKALRDEMVAQGENLTAVFAAFRDAIADLNITVNVPDMPPPVVNIPEIIVPAAKITMPKPKLEKQKIKRDRDGLIVSTETEIVY